MIPRASAALRSRLAGGLAALVCVVLAMLGGTATTAAAPSDELSRYLDLPMINRNAAAGPGGIHPDLPYDLATLRRLVAEARARHLPEPRYAALLLQYRLVDVTDAAGIDLATWDPRAGVEANRANLVASYRYYEDLQLAHRELQWAGMGGLVGADFGGGLLDFELSTNIYDLPGMQQTANALVGEVVRVFGPAAVDELPAGLPALARVGAQVTAEDLRHILGSILVMQKNIFTDLMPMHRAYTTEGLAALEEMHRARLFGDDIMTAWRDVASKEPGRVAAGNAALLQREQGQVIKDQWDETRAYKGDVGEAITYAATVGGSPRVAGVVPPRQFRPVRISGPLADGRTATLTMPLPDWNWSVYPERWEYISSELLPKYRATVENDWPRLESELRRPYDVQLAEGRPLANVPRILESALQGTQVTIS